ncbi:MAG: acetyl-CoA C-acetyltransferase [Odoribacteraceae bacterium]|jgi:acetyl-CoA C-acetyltransferase|nr:acetyl-CoA C-acetyltransferase [Odoribacteraceae bacterium]
MNNVYIIAAKRTAIGKFLGSIANVPAAELAAAVIRAIIKETAIDPALVDEVIVGNVLHAGQRQGVARQAALRGGIPVEVPAHGINMICGSGMRSVIAACRAIRAGEASLVLAGGVESMSGAGFIIPAAARQGIKMGDITTLDHVVCDGLTDAFSGLHMGVTAENIAERRGISRADQDAFAFASQRKAISAIDAGKFREEIVPVEVASRAGTVVFDTDEFPNRSTTPEKLATLKPAFKKDGTVTAGNASGINDGASFLLVASGEAVDRLGLKPLAEIIATGQGGVDPSMMGMGPVPAIARALQSANRALADVELIELNEAFAAQSLGVIRQLAADHGTTESWIASRTNVNGGALALGHPIGASGNRIIVTLLHEMIRSDKRLGLASLCIGGGMGCALLLQR